MVRKGSLQLRYGILHKSLKVDLKDVVCEDRRWTELA
jgi:hypothetical protein